MPAMRRTAPTLLLFALAACGADVERAEEDGPRLPATVRHLSLARRSAEITAAEFPHGAHLDPAFVGEKLSCSRCHHTLVDVPGSLPAGCGDCHPMEPEEGKPPDL